MNIQTKYRLSLPDIRKATYFGLCYRCRMSLKIAAAVLLVVTVYLVYQLALGGMPNPIVLFIGSAYLVWGLILFANAERGIRKHIKDLNNVLNSEYVTSVENRKVHISLPERNISNAYAMNKLICVFELSDMFLIYPTVQDVFMLPKRALSQEGIGWLRETLHAQMGDNFNSRFLKKRN